MEFESKSRPPLRPASPRLPLVGRARELELLTDRLAQAGRGEGGVALLSGEPGIGKTRLLDELAERARAGGWLVLSGQAYDTEGMPSYLPFAEAIGQYLSGGGDDGLKARLARDASELALLIPSMRELLFDSGPAPSLGPEADRYRLFEAVSDFLLSLSLSSKASGLLFCLDDLHWADESTLLMLDHLARRATGARFLILATYRDTDLEASSPLARTLEQLTRLRLPQRIELKALHRDEVAGLLAVLGRPDPPAALLDTVFNETEGNPFFVVELFEYLAADGRLFGADGAWRSHVTVDEAEVPQGLRLVVGQRLERLSEASRRVLAPAAVLGRSFSFGLLQSLTGLAEDALLTVLEEAERAQILTSDASGLVAFSHELIRQTVLSGLLQLRSQRLHLRAAAAIEAIHGRNLEPHLAELAGHYLQAGAAADPETAIEYLVAAGHQARSVFAFEEASRFYQSALDLVDQTPSPDRQQRCDLLLSLGDALLWTDTPLEATRDVMPKAFELAEMSGDSPRASRACEIALRGLHNYGALGVMRGPDAALWCERARFHAQPRTAAQVTAEMYAARAFEAAGRFAEGRQLALNAIAVARELEGEKEPLLWAVSQFLAMYWLPGDAALRLELVEEARHRVEEMSFSSRGPFLFYGGATYLDCGDPLGARELWGQLRELASTKALPEILLFAIRAEGISAILEGRLGDAVAAGMRLLALAVERGRRARGWQLFTMPTHRALLLRGEAEEAAELQREGATYTFEPPSQVGEGAGGGVTSTRLALLLAHAGHKEQARQLLLSILPSQAKTSGGLETLPKLYLVHLLETAVLVEDRAAAECLFEVLAQDPEGSITAMALTSAGRHLGAAAALLGKPGEARDYYLQALAACEQIGFRPEVALIRLQFAQLLLDHYPNERAAAYDHLDFVIPEFEAMEMQPALDRALRLWGRRRPRTDGLGPSQGGLTEREAEVLRLIAGGRSNQQMADQLVLSIRTVERHINHIYAKIGVHSKAQATAYALQQTPGN